MITKKNLKGLRIYYELLRHMKCPKIKEEQVVKALTSIKANCNEYTYEKLQKINEPQIKWLLERFSKDDYLVTTEKLHQNEIYCKENNGVVYKLNKSIMVIEYPNKDKLYFKITERDTIRFLAGIINKKKVKGKLIVKNVTDLDIFLFNYSINSKYTTLKFQEVLDIMR